MDPTHIASAFVGAGIEGEMIDPSHVDYDRRRRVWNGVADRRPALILRAKTVGDVVKTVRLAAARGVLLAVRGGGHSLPGLSTCDGGIVLDLSLLNAVSVDPLTRIAEVSGGGPAGRCRCSRCAFRSVRACGSDFAYWRGRADSRGWHGLVEPSLWSDNR